jgi:hypothetical protein
VQNGLPYSLTTSGNAPSTLFSGGAGINGSAGRRSIPGVQRNSFRVRNTQVVDLRLSKHIKIHERYEAELLGEAFNLFNHFNPTNQNTLGYSVAGTTAAPVLNFNSTFGQITNANSNFAYTPRQVQLGVRFTF